MALHNVAPRDENIEILDARLVFRNFSGREDKFNVAGKRNVSVVLSPEQAADLKARGVNVRTREPRNEEEDEFHTVKLNIPFHSKGRPPRVVMVSETQQTDMTEDTIHILDNIDIISADVQFRLWEYDPGKFSAQLVKTYIKIREDRMDQRYSNIPRAGAAPTETAGPRFEAYDG